MLFVVTDKMHCGTPGVLRQRLQGAQCIHANDRHIGSQRSVGDRAEGRAAVSALKFLQLRGTTLELNESLVGRWRLCAGPGRGLWRLVTTGQHRDIVRNRGCDSHCIRA